MSRYRDVSKEIFTHFHDLSDRVEPLSIDEAFIDVTEVSLSRGLTATQLAYSLQRQIKAQLDLSCSVGVAPNRFLAKVASDFKKPGGITVVQPHEAFDFLAPLPVRKIWGVGPSTASRLNRLGIFTISDLRALSLRDLIQLFGRAGGSYYALARGIDDRPVEASEQAKSISNESTFSEDLSDLERISSELRELATSVSSRAHRAKLRGSTVNLKVRFSDFTTKTRSRTLSSPTRDSHQLHLTGLELFETTQPNDEAERLSVRLIGIGLSRLTTDDSPRQLELFPEEGFGSAEGT